MSRAFIAGVLQGSTKLSAAESYRTAGALLDAIVEDMRKHKKFSLARFGTFSVRKVKARKALNPRTGEAIRTKASKTVRFKASPVLRKMV